MNDLGAILQESGALSERAKGIEESIGSLLPDHANLRALARSLVEASQALSGGLRVATAPMVEVAANPERPTEAGAEPVPAEMQAPAEAGELGEVEVEAEAEEAPSLALARGMVEIKQVIEQDNLVVDVTDFRFAEKALELVEELDEASREGQKAARVLFECVRAMDVLERDYSLPGYERLGETVRRLRCEVAEFLKRSFGIEFSPDPCVPDSDSPAALARLEAKRISFPSTEPAGRVLAIRRRGAKLPGGTEPAELLVSTGSATPAFTLVHGLARALLAPAGLDSGLRQRRAAAAKETKQKYLPQLVDASEDREATVLRYVANLLQPLNKGALLNDVMRPLLGALSDLGFKAVPVRLGGTFDDSYSTSKYERKSVPSSQPKGTIVEVFQLGFLNRDGVPVQKTTVGVSSGVPAAGAGD